MMQVPELLKPVEREAEQPSTPPSKVSMLTSAARSFAQDEGHDFVHSMETVATINPDAYAKATAVSRYSGIPAKVLHDNSDRMDQLLRGNEYADIYSRYQKTANALRNGNTAAITQDDVDQLTRIEGAAGDARFNQQSTGEKLFGAIRQQWVAMRQSTDVSLTLKHQDELARFDEIDAAEAAGTVPMATREQREQMGVYGLQYLNAPPEQRAELRNFLVQGQVDRLASASADEKTLAAMPIDPGARRAAELEASGQSSLASTAEALVENPGYAVRTAVGAAATSAPMLAAGAIGGPLAAAPIEFGMEYDAKLTDVLREAGVDFNDPKAVMRALQDDALIEEGRRKAGLKAAGTTVVDMISMGLASKLLVPGQIAGRTLSTTQRELANLAVQFPVQGITEGAGEAAGQFLAEGEVDAGEVLLEAVAGAGMSSADVLAFSNRRFIEYLGDGLRTARQTKAGAESLGEMVDASMNSKTRKRDRETFREVAAQQLQDSPMETLWLPAEALQRLNQSSQVDLPALLQEVPGLSEQFADAAARGGSVSLKTSDYLAVFADYHDQLAGSVRINVDGMSVDDAQAWNSEVETQLDALAEQMRMPPDTAAEVRTQMVGELVASGYRRADAEQYAATHLSVMQNLADRTGIALEQLREQYQLDIGAKAPEQLRAVTVDDARIAIQRLRAGDIPRPADMFGQSLREYLVSTGGLNDEGGELAALDADVGSVGRNRVTRAAGGRSLDEAAMDAWERGYFPGVAREEVGAQLIVDGIQSELAGNPVYSAEQENATLRTQSDTLNQLQEYLDRLGVDIADMSDDEVLALLQGQGEQVEGSRLDQPSDELQRAAFRELKSEQTQRFNQSKVTTSPADAETGKPMTVYFARNTASSKGNAPAGMDFGQSIEPAGEYMVIQEADMAEQGGEGWVYGSIQFSNPLVLEHKDTTSNGWKKDLSDMFGGKTGKALTGAVKKAGHDAIVTRDKYGYSETVNLAGVKDAARTLNQSASNTLAEKNLILAHNLSADNLRNTLEIGGLPAPSLAITKADAPIEGFGEITLIGDASLAMPSAKNPVFDADVYSPRFPEVRVKVDEAAVRKVVGPLEAAAESAGIGRGVGGRITEELQRNRLGNAVADVASDAGMRYGYLTQVKGEAFDIPMKAQEVAQSVGGQRGSLIAQEPLKSLVDGIDLGQVEAESPESEAIANALYTVIVARNIQEARDAGRENPDSDGIAYANRRISVFADVIADNPDAVEIAPGVQFNPPVRMKVNGLKRLVDLAANTPNEQQPQPEARQVVDRIELDRQLSERVPDDEIRAWAREQLLPAMGEKRIVKDGGRTVAYSLDNIVKEMTRKVRDSEGFNYGLGNARSRGATKFKSLQQIQARRGQVQSKDETAAAIEQNKKLYDELLDKLSQYHPGRGRGYGRSAWEALPDAIGESYSIGIERALAENEFTDVPADLVEQVKEFASELLQLPTEYFEAKPQRAVQLSEFKGAVVPVGTPEDLVQALEDAGLQVTEYERGDDKARSAAVNDAAQSLQAEHGNVLFQGDDDARGFITFQPRTKSGEQRRFQITLGEKRDLTTLLHELGHYYLEVLDDVAAGENAPEQIKRDMATMRAWMGAEEGKPLTTEQHEQFARGFEKYLAEGKAPNPELAGAFARFKRWLIGVYKDLTRLNVELTDDVRRVFDRLVATDEQIVAAEQVSNAIPLFADAQAAGMSEAEYAAYQDSIAIAHADAQESVEREVQREEELRRSKWWREESAKVRREVVEEVDTVREYAALRALRTGNMPDGTTLPLKLNSGELVERYGASTARRLAFTHSRTGQPLDVAAPMLGYESGDQMIKAMLGVTPRSQLIEQEVQQRMLERHGPKSTGEAAERALDAVHNERRADVLTKELRALGKQGNRNNITSQQILKEAARRIMAERKVRDIQPAEYQRAEAKAGREAFDAMTRGNVEAAYEAKQRQLMNFYLYREARKARENVDTIVSRLAKYNKRSKREQLGKAGESYLDQIDTVMEQYEFRTVSLRELDKRVTFQAWYADQLARGNEPYVPEFVLNNSERINYKELSLSQLQELDEFVANVNHLAKTKNRLLANKRIRDFDEARTELIRAGYNNLAKRKKPPIDKNTRTMLEKIGDGASEFSAALIKMEQVVDWLDDGQVDGPWSTTFWQPFVEAQAEKERLNREFAIKMTTLVDAYTAERGAKVMRQQTYIASLGQSLTHNAILSAALNTGNASNRKKLLDGGHNGKAWTEQQLAEITGNMNKTDWAFVQSMWDLVEELWPSIEQLEKDLHGIPPAKVEAIPVVTQFGEFRGGYWPLVYDTSAAAYAGVQNQLGNEGGLFEQGYARATTPKGHTKARVDSFAAPILLDVEIIAQHLGQVIHDLTHRKAIRDGAKIVGDKQIKQMLIDTLGVNVANQFNPWLQGVANDMVLDSQKGIDAWTRGAERLRANLAIGWMGFSATTGLQQILGYSQTFEFFSKIGAKRYIFQGMQEFIRAPFKAIEFVNDLSPEMRYRVDNLDRDMRGVLKRIAGKGDTLSVVQQLAFKHIAVIQALVDYPTWIAGYRHGLDSGLTADDAVAAGDRAVRLSQMAAGPKDLAAIQRKDGLMRALTIVYSYFNLLYNRQVDIGKAFRTAKGMADYLNAFERTMFLIAIPAIAGPLVTGNGPGDDEDWRAWASLKILTYPLLAIPGVRDLASGIESGWGYKGATPLGDLFVTLNKLANVGTKAVQGEEQDLERVTVLGIEAAGYGFGLPVAQPKRTVKYLFGVSEGDIEPEGVTDWMRGLLFGPPKE